MPDQPTSLMRVYQRRTLWGRKRWWYDCSTCGITNGPFGDQDAAISGIGRHGERQHQPAVERMARFLAGAAHVNPQRDTPPWDSLDTADRDHWREQARRVTGQPAEHCGELPPGLGLDGAIPPGECVLRPGHAGSHATETGMRWWLTTTGARTTPDNPATSADADEDPLHEARMWARHGYELGQRSCTWSDYGVAPSWLIEGWPTHFASSDPPAGELELEHLRSLLAEAVDWIPDGELRERIRAALNPQEQP